MTPSQIKSVTTNTFSPLLIHCHTFLPFLALKNHVLHLFVYRSCLRVVCLQMKEANRLLLLLIPYSFLFNYHTDRIIHYIHVIRFNTHSCGIVLVTSSSEIKYCSPLLNHLHKILLTPSL